MREEEKLHIRDRESYTLAPLTLWLLCFSALLLLTKNKVSDPVSCLTSYTIATDSKRAIPIPTSLTLDLSNNFAGRSLHDSVEGTAF